MDKATVIGMVLGTAAIIIGIFLGGSILGFIDPPSIFIVIGGTISVLLISFPMNDIKSLIKIMKNAFLDNQKSMKETIELLVQLSERARKEGILAIEKVLEDIDDAFLSSGLRLAVDGSDPEAIKESMEIELQNIETRHKRGQQILDTGGAMAPAFGMIGTLIGLVNMLKTMSDPSSIGPSMAIALLTTFYGAVMANLIFIPLNTKLQGITAREVNQKELIIDGVIGIQGGDNPRMLRAKLETYLPPSLREKE